MSDEPADPPERITRVDLNTLTDPHVQEEFARESYYVERSEDAAADREHELEYAQYFCLSWECLTDESRRPYRTAAAVTCDLIARSLV